MAYLANNMMKNTTSNKFYKTKKLTSGIIQLVAVLLFSMITTQDVFAKAAVAFDGGNGTESDPYQISSWTDLADVNNDLDAHYVLTEDLDENTEGYDSFASSTANGGNGWDPLGSETIKFSGSFDGGGHAIEGLYINRDSETLNGLFGYIGTGGEVRNLGVTNVDLTGQNQMGGLAGKNNGLIENSFTTGVVDGRERTGGLVGHNEGGGRYSTATAVRKLSATTRR